jgi:hypothetical protein
MTEKAAICTTGWCDQYGVVIPIKYGTQNLCLGCWTLSPVRTREELRQDPDTAEFMRWEDER